MSPDTPKTTTDWEAVEMLFRQGVLSLRAIATQHNCTEGAIRKRAKKEGWTRDLKAKVQAKAEELVRKAEVRTEVRKGASFQATERAQVEVAAQLQANVVLEHRQDIRRSRTLFQRLMDELEAQVADPELFERLGEIMDKSGEDEESGRTITDKLNEAYHKVISMSGRVDNARKLTETLERVVKMERQAFGLDDKGQGEADESTKKLTDVERAVRLMHFLQEVQQ